MDAQDIKATTEIERKEKNQATIISVLASLVLTVLKLVAGILTGSIGLLAEAAHSGLDFVASIITFISVRIARRPADSGHPYGHERVENLSAIIQGCLLLATASWIAYESVNRLFAESVSVRPSGLAFAVIGITIITDIWRSRILLRVARKYRSRALEADAQNFRADLLSSTAVLLGLTLVAVGRATGNGGFLDRADAVAALMVAGIIFYKSGELLLGSVNVLIDRAPENLEEEVREAVASVDGVVCVTSVRMRESGSRTFADVVVSVPRTVSTTEAHEITERVEEAIRAVDERAESFVHAEPTISDEESAAQSVRATALSLGFSTHHERAWRTSDDRWETSLHVEVEPDLSLRQAHDRTRGLGTAIRESDHRFERVTTHIEPADPDPERSREITQDHPDLVARIKRVVTGGVEEANCHEVRFYASEENSKLDAVLHCDFPPYMNVEDAHRGAEAVERTLRNSVPELGHLLVHAEPR